MKVDIMDSSGAIEYKPRKNTYGMRIFPSFTRIEPPCLIKSDNWLEVNSYYFDDMWPKSWKEYSWVDFKEPGFSRNFGKSWEDVEGVYPKMTQDSFRGLLESRGWPTERCSFFDKDIAEKILNDFEECKNSIENIMIHCRQGENRAPAVGIAMNDIYGWEIEGLKEEFLHYRRYVYDIMKSV